MTPMRDCSGCPARTDCMASVLRRGPLLNGCDGMQRGWQTLATEAPVTMPDYVPECIHETKILRQLRELIAGRSRFTMRDVQEMGILESTARYRLMQMVKRGELIVHKNGGGPTAAVWFERRIAKDEVIHEQYPTDNHAGQHCGNGESARRIAR